MDDCESRLIQQRDGLSDARDAFSCNVADNGQVMVPTEDYASTIDLAVGPLLVIGERKGVDETSFHVIGSVINGSNSAEDGLPKVAVADFKRYGCRPVVDYGRMCLSGDETVPPVVAMPTVCDHQSRFRVVKIDSSEPAVQRGRWMCVNFHDTAAPSLSLGRAADWLHEDVGYSSGSSVSSSGLGGGQNALLCFLSDNESPVGRPVDASRVQSEVVQQVIPVLSSPEVCMEHVPSFNPEAAWLDGSSDSGFIHIDESKSPLCVMTHVPSVSNLDQLDDCIDSSKNGASAVAIDNKIEQAMDLVKSHLMFAVREEVELLKEQIKLLTERNSQLERENHILRAAALPETLALLSARPPPMT